MFYGAPDEGIPTGLCTVYAASAEVRYIQTTPVSCGVEIGGGIPAALGPEAAVIRRPLWGKWPDPFQATQPATLAPAQPHSRVHSRDCCELQLVVLSHIAM